MSYTDFKAADFLLEESFINYCTASNEEDIAFWENYLQTHPEQAQEIRIAQELCHIIAVTPAAEDKEQVLARLKQSVENEPSLHIPSKDNSRIYRWMAAASVAAVFIIGYLLYKPASPTAPVYEISVALAGKYLPVAHTAFNDRQTITLPDGSRVTLNGSSTLTIAPDFNSRSRYVYLQGEAFFEIHQDKDRPFVVITPQTATTALGTSFLVKSGKRTQEANIKLATGRIKVQAIQNNQNMATLELSPGQQVQLDARSYQFNQSDFDTTEIQRWLTRKLEFVNADMQQISQQLEWYYGATIQLENTPKDTVLFTGVFQNKRFNEVLDAISFSNNFSYRQLNDTVFIRFE
ncbi:FecR domain-containing protein [Chitinophaga defluvii]|uniref:FecR domain-containing protein n=1 Tax=Chitinophaga defluvii TaxID=3163343 RepID=A0ABV2T5V2_9BACT